MSVFSDMTLAEAHAKANRNLTGSANDGGLGYMVYTLPAGQEFIGSNGKLNPQNNATRAEVAAILMRFCENVK